MSSVRAWLLPTIRIVATVPRAGQRPLTAKFAGGAKLFYQFGPHTALRHTIAIIVYLGTHHASRFYRLSIAEY